MKCTIHCKAAEDDGGVGRSVISQAKKKATLTSFRIRDVPRLKLDLDHMKLWTLSQAPKDGGGVGGGGGGGRSVCSQASQKETGAEEKQRQCLVEANTGCSLSWRQSYLAWSWRQLLLILFQEAWHFDWNWVESGKAKSRPQDYRPGQKAELRVSDGDTKHVSCPFSTCLQNMWVFCLSTFYMWVVLKPLSTCLLRKLSKNYEKCQTQQQRVKNTQDSHQNHRTYLSRYIWKQLGNCDPSFDWILQI